MSMTGSLSVLKMSVLSKSIYNFNSIPVKILARHFVDTDKIILKFIFKRKE